MWNLSNAIPPIFSHSPHGCSVVIGEKTVNPVRKDIDILNYVGDYFADLGEFCEASEYIGLESYYYRNLKSGVFYRPLCYYEVKNKENVPIRNLTRITTKKSSKSPYRGRGLDGEVETNVLLPLIDSIQLKEICNLKHLNYEDHIKWLIAPLDPDTGKLMLHSDSSNNSKRQRIFPKLDAYWKKCQVDFEIANRNRFEKTRVFIEENYGFNNNLIKHLYDLWESITNRITDNKWDTNVFKNHFESCKKRKVIHNVSGDTLRAIRVPLNVIIDSKLHYIICDTEQEAKYLVGVVNAPIMQPIWRATKTSSRHYGSNPLKKIPVPKFDVTNTLHLEIAKVINNIECYDDDYFNQDILISLLAPLNDMVRKLLAGLFDTIKKYDNFYIR